MKNGIGQQDIYALIVYYPQVSGARVGKYEVKREGKTPIAIPQSTIMLFFQEKKYIPISFIWIDKHYDVWLPIGEYQFIRIDEKKKPKRKKKDKKETPLFGDLSKGYEEFSIAQGHQIKK